MRIFVIGDIHGRVVALKDVLGQCKFNKDEDKLIILGDIVDGGPDSYLVVEELMTIKNKVFVLGNHDKWFIDYMKGRYVTPPWIWTTQGGNATLNSYGWNGRELPMVPITHQVFFDSAVLYHMEFIKHHECEQGKNKIIMYSADNLGNMECSYCHEKISKPQTAVFVHGGFDEKLGIENTPDEVLMWDRDLINLARWRPIRTFHDKIFVGHTSTKLLANDHKIKNYLQPLKFNNLIMMDTGAGWDGVLSIMDVDTEEFWCSIPQIPNENRVNSYNRVSMNNELY